MDTLPFPDCLLDLVADYTEHLHEAYALQAPASYLLARSRTLLDGQQFTFKGRMAFDHLFAWLYLQDYVPRRVSSAIVTAHRPASEEWPYRTMPRGLRLLLLELSTRDRYGQPTTRWQPTMPKNRSWKFVDFELSVFGAQLFNGLRLRLDLSDTEFSRRFVSKRNLVNFCRAARKDPNLGLDLVHCLVSSRGEPALRACLHAMQFDFRIFDRWFGTYPGFFMGGLLSKLACCGEVEARMLCARLIPRLGQQADECFTLRGECHNRLLARAKTSASIRALVTVLQEKFGLGTCSNCASNKMFWNL